MDTKATNTKKTSAKAKPRAASYSVKIRDEHGGRTEFSTINDIAGMTPEQIERRNLTAFAINVLPGWFGAAPMPEERRAERPRAAEFEKVMDAFEKGLREYRDAMARGEK
jgi:hypothetical protein